MRARITFVTVATFACTELSLLATTGVVKDEG
jgi:hypothetical protein